MAGLEVDHVEAGRLGVFRSDDVGVDQPLDVGVGEHAGGVTGVHAVAGVEQRMVVGDSRDAARGHWLAEPARVRELECDNEIIVAATLLAVCRLHLGEQRGEAGAAAGRRGELIGIGPALGEHGHCFPSPDQLRAAEPKVPPAAQEDFRGRTLGAAVPAFHRMNAPAVTDGAAAEHERLSQR